MLYLRNGYPKSRQNHDATIDKLESTDSAPIKPSIKLLLVRGIVIIVYLLLGALVFRALEFKERDKTYWKRKVNEEKLQLVKEFNISLKRLDHFEYLSKKKRFEYLVSHKDWDYYESLYFASTVTTTIGYGHITPQTQSGRLFLIIYALIGIPLNILALASVGEHITVAIFCLLRYLSRRRNVHTKMTHINIKVMLVSVFLMAIMLFLGGMLYCSTENWTYVDSIYYCFVAMATIGFGDLVPNRGRAPDTEKEKAIWFVRALYISIGLSLVSTVFTALSNAMEEINLLLGRGKYTNAWFPNHKDDETEVKNGHPKEERKRKESQEESEKISYKHKIKKQGSYVMKYKVFGKFKRRKKGCLTPSDWDGLLADAKQKQTSDCSTPSEVRDMATKPTVIVLSDHKKPLTRSYTDFHKDNFLLLPVIPDCDTNSSHISASEESSPNDPFENENVLNVTNRTRLEIHPNPNTRRVERLHSSPAEIRRDSFYHKEIYRNYSDPLRINKTVETPVFNDSTNMKLYENYYDHNFYRRTRFDYRDIATRYDRDKSISPKSVEEDYDILLNQC